MSLHDVENAENCSTHESNQLVMMSNDVWNYKNTKTPKVVLRVQVRIKNCPKFNYSKYYHSVLRPEAVAQVAERPTLANRHVRTVAGRHVLQRVGLVGEACLHSYNSKIDFFLPRTWKLKNYCLCNNTLLLLTDDPHCNIKNGLKQCFDLHLSV